MNNPPLIKAVLDSNILVSAFLIKRGASYHLLQAAKQGIFTLSLSPDILAETQHVLLTYQRIRKRYQYSDEDLMEYIHGLGVVAHIVSELPRVQRSRDPKDDMVLATAIKAKADYLVTGDKDLLVLGKYSPGGEIVPPQEFLRLLKRGDRR